MAISKLDLLNFVDSGTDLDYYAELRERSPLVKSPLPLKMEKWELHFTEWGIKLQDQGWRDQRKHVEASD